ncbi:hypothetical protein BDV26DRAFT_270641 [Aspergillus bertholletiae]|uniref:Secreted protein n=1 Tax=Aspergillus bertholletiae TaxID=1226010 RepID=A0A5N7AW82_9EURO|nr:hypothetical protein BDV26DRAFT_270641 [Aspergillus bertholletiae]
MPRSRQWFQGLLFIWRVPCALLFNFAFGSAGVELVNVSWEWEWRLGWRASSKGGWIPNGREGASSSHGRRRSPALHTFEGEFFAGLSNILDDSRQGFGKEK